MAGVGAGVGLLVHWTGVMATGLSGGLSGIWIACTMVTLGGNAVGVSFGTLGEGAGQSIWNTAAGEVCGAFIAGAVWGLAVTLEKYGRVFGWQIIDCLKELQTVLEWGVGDPRRVRGRPRWQRLWSCWMGRGNCAGKTPYFWRCVLRGYVECRRSDIGSGQGRVRDTNHQHHVGTRCDG